MVNSSWRVGALRRIRATCRRQAAAIPALLIGAADEMAEFNAV
jgi:hypothetical protein